MASPNLIRWGGSAALLAGALPKRSPPPLSVPMFAVQRVPLTTTSHTRQICLTHRVGGYSIRPIQSNAKARRTARKPPTRSGSWCGSRSL
jgi:hypothetical protein